MNEALDTGLELDEGSKLRYAGDGAADALTDLITAGRGLPGLGLKLLEAERNLFRFRIDFEDADLHLLADGQHVIGFANAVPRDVTDVQEAIDSPKVNECAVGHHAAYGTGDGIAFLHGGVA